MVRILMVGFHQEYLMAIHDALEPRSIVILEEPDIIRKRNLAGKRDEIRCISAIIPVAYQQSMEYLDPGRIRYDAWDIETVFPSKEYAVPAAARIAEYLGLPGATEKAAQRLRNKDILREVTGRAGILNPRWQEIHGPRDILDFAAGGPVVVKPANRHASVGVHLLDYVDEATAEAVWQSLMQTGKYHQISNQVVETGEYSQIPDRPMKWRYLVEERLQGPEYSVEALVHDGEVLFENVTEKSLIPGPHPVELGHVVPAPLQPECRNAFGYAMQALVAATGFRTGILHGEWILTNAGPALVECAGRCPGDRIADLIDLAYGTRLRVDLLELLAGRTPILPREPRQASAIRFIGGTPGRVVRVEGLDEATSLPGVRELEVNATEGSELKTWTSSWDRPGHVIVTAPNSAAAKTRAIDAADRIRFIIADVTR